MVAQGEAPVLTVAQREPGGGLVLQPLAVLVQGAAISYRSPHDGRNRSSGLRSEALNPYAVGDVWIPLELFRPQMPQERENRNGLFLVGRRAAGVSVEAVEEDLGRLAREIREENPITMSRSTFSTLPLVERETGPARPVPPVPEMDVTVFQMVSPGYFEGLGVPLRRGRMFRASDDAESEPVAILSESLARQFWPDPEVDPVGKRIAFEFAGGAADPQPLWRTIVGVVADLARRRAALGAAAARLCSGAPADLLVRGSSGCGRIPFPQNPSGREEP